MARHIQASGFIEGIGDALLEGDNRIVGDADVFRTDLGAALGDVASADVGLLPHPLTPVESILGMHLQ